MQYLLLEKNEKILTSEELFTKSVFLQTAKELRLLMSLILSQCFVLEMSMHVYTSGVFHTDI